MPLFALLSDDGLSIREIRNFVEGTVFKPGKAFPVVYAAQPVFDSALSSLVEVWNLPVNGTVTVSWSVVDLPQAAKDSNAKIKNLKDLYDTGDMIDAKWATATNQEQKDIGRIAFQLIRKMKQQLLDAYRP